MEFSHINQVIRANNLTLTPITNSDKEFINLLFEDYEIRKYYIVPKEAGQDFRKLVDYWINDIKRGAGTCWIISQKDSSISSSESRMGFVAFEFRGSLNNASISYAILQEFRCQGIASTSVRLVLETFAREEIQSVEADIDIGNANSIRVAQKLGFRTNKSLIVVDSVITRDGESLTRNLWKKELIEFDPEIITGRIPLDAPIGPIAFAANRVASAINKGSRNPNLYVRYYYLDGRLKFLESKYEEAAEAFGQSNMISINEGLPHLHENFYWFARIREIRGGTGNAEMFYKEALVRFHENSDYISRDEIIFAMTNK